MYKLKIVFENNDIMLLDRRYDSFEDADAKGPYWCRKAYVDLAYPGEGYPTYEVVGAEEE